MSGPWLEAFRRDPHRAIADLFSGRAGAGSDLRLDVPELLYQLFPTDMAGERAQLDDALGSWLSDMREDYASQVKRLGFPVYGKRVGDALVALQLLDLPQTRDRIRADTGAWLRRLSPLRLAPERDPGLECFRLLTRGQPDARHMALWLRLATDPRPEYLTVALAGLRLLPNQGNARKNQVLMLQALLRHVANIHHDAGKASAFFNRRLAALRGLFPRGPQHWNRALDEALESFPEHTEEPIGEGIGRRFAGRFAGERSSPIDRKSTDAACKGRVGRSEERHPSFGSSGEGAGAASVRDPGAKARLRRGHRREPLLRPHAAQPRHYVAGTAQARFGRHDPVRSHDRTRPDLGTGESLLLDALGGMVQGSGPWGRTRSDVA